MASVTRDQINAAIQQYIDPCLGQDLVSAKCVKNIAIDGDKVNVEIVLGFPAAGHVAQLEAQLKEKVAALEGVAQVEISISSKVEAHTAQKGVKPIAGVKNIIAIASGKGGVGKSTTAVNLACALAAEGATVGILDADIYGPSQPRMLGVNAKPESKDGKSLEPLVGHGIQSMSIGYLVEEETPMIWRGPMVTQALEQLLNDTQWKDVDYLIIDLPPGTGDIQLTLAQKVPVSGAVIVTTPQDIALLDAKKALKMFEKVDVHVLGIVENMSIHICSQCGHEEHIFGKGGGQSMSDQYGVDFIGSLPLDIKIREEVDSGRPTVAVDPDGAIARSYREIARRMAAKLSLRAKEFSAKFPNIVIQNN
ncbi:MAG: iron-sulfur cluster carrier protein ApbC [Gammaproteobacteria bacterium]|nr:iron-sulfur cluster carrier protein ApbC [Gammaproteobacteria bacterium]MDH5803323.1 iron-sulfur cluster carrier protein ApbC [Gammaproteobacteria bacterium]